MTLDEYQLHTKTTAKCPVLRLLCEIDGGYYDQILPVYEALGMSGEVGEAIELIKKMCRHNGKDIEELKPKLKLELGDVLWYLARLADEFGFSLNEVAEANLVKLQERHGAIYPSK